MASSVFFQSSFLLKTQDLYIRALKTTGLQLYYILSEELQNSLSK